MPLTLKGAPVDGLRRIGKAWGTARLDAVLNLMPLRKPSEIDLNIALLQGIVQGFMPALAAREGQIITVVARPFQRQGHSPLQLRQALCIAVDRNDLRPCVPQCADNAPAKTADRPQNDDPPAAQDIA